MSEAKRGKFFNIYRVASMVFMLFAIGHSVGALLHPKSFGLEADAVVASMTNVYFDCARAGCSWHQFYLGFGWFCTIFMLFSAFVTWHIAGLEARDRHAFTPIAWALCASYAAAAAISWVYLFPVPALFSLLLAVLLAGANLARRSHGEMATA